MVFLFIILSTGNDNAFDVANIIYSHISVYPKTKKVENTNERVFLAHAVKLDRLLRNA